MGYQMSSRTLFKEIDGFRVIIHLDSEGEEIRRIKVCPVDFVPTRLPPRSGVSVSQLKDPAGYHREYYHKVRSKRDGKTRARMHALVKYI